MAQGDIYEVKLGGLFLGQSTLNVFFYYQATEVTNINYAVQLSQAFQAFWVNDGSDTPFTSVAFSNDWEIMSIGVRNLFNEAEIGGALIGGVKPGTQTGVNAASFTAYHFRTDRPNGAIRRGHKYFGGVPGGISVDGILVPTVVTALGVLETGLGTDLLVDIGESQAQFRPCVVKRIKEDPDETHADYWYRLPENATEALFFLADDWTLDDRLTTMNSRKLGRGN